MAEEEAAAKGGANFLTRKIGPLPAGVWIGAFAVIWWYLQKRQKASTAPTQVPQTDPAGNVGPIDPATGYVYGTPQDTAGLAANAAVPATTTGAGGSTIGGQYATNDAWANAAINYLVGIGIDPTAANAAIAQFLASQPLDVQQQADVNQAIQRLGAPPSPPQPVGSPTPIVTPPSPGTVYASNPPSGFTVTDKSPTSVTLRWNRATNATGYTVTWGTTPAAKDGSTTVSGTATAAALNGLTPNALYYVHVQANPAKPGDPFAALVVSTSKLSGGTPPMGGTIIIPRGTPGMTVPPPGPTTIQTGGALVPTRTR